MRCKNAFVITSGRYISQTHYIKLLLALVLQSKFQFVYFSPVISTKLSCFIKSVYISAKNWGCLPSFNRLKFCSSSPCQLWLLPGDEKMKSKTCQWMNVPSMDWIPLKPCSFSDFPIMMPVPPKSMTFSLPIFRPIYFSAFMNTKPLPCPFLSCFFLSLKICHSSVSTATQLCHSSLCIS